MRDWSNSPTKTLRKLALRAGLAVPERVDRAGLLRLIEQQQTGARRRAPQLEKSC